jgi:hypothetical protein
MGLIEEIQTFGTLSTSFTYLYKGVTGDPLSAAAIPVGAYCLHKIGEYTNREQIRHFGQTVTTLSAFMTPGIIAGKAICYVTGATVLGQTLAFGAAALVTLKVFQACVG